MTNISSLLQPRTVLLVTSFADGIHDVATFSFVTPISFKPQLLAFSIGHARYTKELIEKNPECVINVSTKEMLDDALYCGTRTGRNTDKYEKIEWEESSKVKPRRIKKSPVQLECKVKKVIPAGDHNIVLCEVVLEHVKTMDYTPLMHVSGNEFATPTSLKKE